MRAVFQIPCLSSWLSALRLVLAACVIGSPTGGWAQASVPPPGSGAGTTTQEAGSGHPLWLGASVGGGVLLRGSRRLAAAGYDLTVGYRPVPRFAIGVRYSLLTALSRKELGDDEGSSLKLGAIALQLGLTSWLWAGAGGGLAIFEGSGGAGAFAALGLNVFRTPVYGAAELEVRFTSASFSNELLRDGVTSLAALVGWHY